MIILERVVQQTLDILYKNNDVWVSYSEDHGKYKSTTSIAKGKFNSNKINNILGNDYIKLISSAFALSLAIIFINRQTSFIYFQF